MRARHAAPLLLTLLCRCTFEGIVGSSSLRADDANVADGTIDAIDERLDAQDAPMQPETAPADALDADAADDSVADAPDDAVPSDAADDSVADAPDTAVLDAPGDAPACRTDAECASGQHCASNMCVAGGCATGLTACGGACLDLMSDLNNCGACGVFCPSGFSCQFGVCMAPPDAGGCRTSAECMPDESCVGNVCEALTCATGQTACGHACVDLTSDPNNCGACGDLCPSGISCTAGACR